MTARTATSRRAGVLSLGLALLVALLAIAYLVGRGQTDPATAQPSAATRPSEPAIANSEPTFEEAQNWEASPQARMVHDVLVAAKAGDLVGVERFIPTRKADAFNYTAIDEQAPAWQPNWRINAVVWANLTPEQRRQVLRSLALDGTLDPDSFTLVQHTDSFRWTLRFQVQTTDGNIVPGEASGLGTTLLRTLAYPE